MMADEGILDNNYDDLSKVLRSRARIENQKLRAKRLEGSQLRHEYLDKVTTLPSVSDDKISFDELYSFFWGIDYSDMRQKGKIGRNLGYGIVRVVDLTIIVAVWLMAALIYSCTSDFNNPEKFRPSIGQFQHLLDLRFVDATPVRDAMSTRSVKEMERDAGFRPPKRLRRLRMSGVYLSTMALSIFILSRTIYIMIMIRHVLLVLWISIVAIKRSPGVKGIKLMLQ